MAGISSIRSMPAYRKVLIAVVIVVVSYTLFGFFGLPAILKSVLPKTLTDTLHRKTTIREIRFNPFELSVSIRGLDIAEREGKGAWVSADEIFANLKFASIFRGGPVLSEIRLVKPYASIVRHRDGSYNFSDLVEEFSKKPAKQEQTPQLLLEQYPGDRRADRFRRRAEKNPPRSAGNPHRHPFRFQFAVFRRPVHPAVLRGGGQRRRGFP